MLEPLKRMWFGVFDRPRCSMCQGYSRPSQLVCSDECESKLDDLRLLPGRHGERRAASRNPSVSNGRNSVHLDQRRITVRPSKFAR